MAVHNIKTAGQGCPACGERFAEPLAFDRHRVGTDGTPGRCTIHPSYTGDSGATVNRHWQDDAGSWHYGKTATRPSAPALADILQGVAA